MSFDLKLSNGDISIKDGDLEPIRGASKLLQDILKIAITPAGTNPYALWYGSLISKSLIGSYLDDAIIIDAAKNQLQLALSALQTMQNLQREGLQRQSADEQLASILDISIARSKLDPRFFTVTIQAMSRAFKRIKTSFTVSPF